MWIVASAQSTSEPFIQIFPVPNDIQCRFGDGSTAIPEVTGQSRMDRQSLLFLITERTPVGAGVQRLAAVPAEPRARGFARPQARLDALDVVASRASRGRRHGGRLPGGARSAK